MDTNDRSLPPGSRFFRNAIPAVLSLILTSGVVIVDGWFVGRFIGAEALAAVNLTVPVLYGFLAIAIMIAVGGASLAVPWLGRGRPEEAARIRTASLLVLGGIAAALALAAFLGRRPLLALLGARDGLAVPAAAYFRVMCAAYPLQMISVGLAIFLRNSGSPMSALRNGLAANLLNVALDGLFVAGLGWGTGGAALATLAAAALQCGLSIASSLRGGPRLGFARPSFRPGELFSVLANGSSEFVGQVSVMICAWAFNRSALALYGMPGLAALTVLGYLSFLQAMVMTGCAIGLAPIAGYGWGAGDAAGVKAARRTALITAELAGVVFFGAAALGGPAAASAWTGGNPDVAAAATAGFALYALSFLANGYNFLAAAFLTALQDAAGSAAVAILRGLVLPLLFLAVLPRLVGPRGLWLAAPAAEFLTLAAAWILSTRGLRRLNAGFAVESAPSAG